MSSLERIRSIYVLGSTTRDEVTRIQTRFSDNISLAANRKINFTTSIESEFNCLGGTGINIVCNLRQFCNRDIYLFTVTGQDNEDIFRLLAQYNIKSDFVISRKGYSTSKAKGILDQDENHIWLIEDSVTKGVDFKMPSSVDSESTLAFLAPIRRTVYMRFVEWAADYGIDYVFDPGMLVDSLSEKDIVRGIKSSRWLIANEEEMYKVLNKSDLTLDEIRAKGVNVIVTRGAKGVIFYDRFNEYEVPGLIPSTIADTSGAGDAWRAAFWGSLIMGKSLEYSLKIANSWASFSIEKYGVIGDFPKMESVIKRANL